MPRPKRVLALTSSTFADFLRRLDADEPTAGLKYQQLRSRLRWYFERQGRVVPDELVDETIDRALGKISDGAAIPNLHSFLVGIARFVMKEYRKKKPVEVELSPDLPIQRSPAKEEIGDYVECLQRCLSSLPVESRDLFLQYHQETRDRAALAKASGVSLSVLRQRILRLKEKLYSCVTSCVAGPPLGNTKLQLAW
jgi:DNA-directed RNA polymerase specialized sigma24 family protein